MTERPRIVYSISRCAVMPNIGQTNSAVDVYQSTRAGFCVLHHSAWIRVRLRSLSARTRIDSSIKHMAVCGEGEVRVRVSNNIVFGRMRIYSVCVMYSVLYDLIGHTDDIRFSNDYRRMSVAGKP